jgi:hypothetical protein
VKARGLVVLRQAHDDKANASFYSARDDKVGASFDSAQDDR